MHFELKSHKTNIPNLKHIAQMDDIGLILKSLEFAAGRHRTQFRKGADKTPYINHPIQVAELLANYAGENDPILLSAAILHDVIEDTVDTAEEKDELIKQMLQIFGEQILTLVLEVTDDKSLEDAVRKQKQIEDAPHKSIKAKKLKIADKINNVRDITSNPPVGWPLQRILAYFDWAEKVVEGLRGVNKKLEELFDDTLIAARVRYEG
jgi:guanosine-3',5'-bis(diphosphate) 3'-pyrophosphohydrolase